MTDEVLKVSMDMSHIVGAVAGVLMEPYVAFLERLEAEGRVTPAEVEGVRRQQQDLYPRLADLVEARLKLIEADRSRT